jgi:hypothetical protein
MEYLHIIPTKGLSGYFYLDMSLSKAIKRLRSFSSRLQNIQIIEETSSKRIILNIPDSRVKLIFDDLYQTLQLIEIDLSQNEKPRIPLMFQSSLISDYSELQSQVDLPGEVLEISPNLKIHQFKGFSLLLSPTSKIFIHKSNSFPFDEIAVKVRIYEVTQGKVSIKHMTGKSEDIDWLLYPESVIDLLGTPDSVRRSEENTDFLYVFKHEGLDFVFDGEKNQLVEIIMHSNMPESIEFNEYDRCHFLLHFDGVSVNPLNRFEEFQQFLHQPVVEVHQKRHTHGFQPTSFFQAGRFVFEVLQTGYVASVAVQAFSL